MAERGNLQERIQVFRNMLAADPENELASFSLGKLLVEAGEHAEAERMLRKSLALNPRQSAAILALGRLLVAGGRGDEAIDLLREGIEIAHRKGELGPRNEMQELLRSLGVEPPDPAASATASPHAPDSPDSRADRGAPGAPSDPDWVCRRCGLHRPRLEKPPFPTELGARIAEQVCSDCWNEWVKEMSVKVINEYRLDLAAPEGARIYDEHMTEFLGLEG